MALSRMFSDSFFRPSIFSTEFHQLFNELDRQMAPLTAATQLSDRSNGSSFAHFFGGPRVKLTEEGNEFKVEAEVPGFPKECLHIGFSDPQTLTLSGRYVQETKEVPATETEHHATKAAAATQSKNDGNHGLKNASEQSDAQTASAAGNTESTGVSKGADALADNRGMHVVGPRVLRNEHVSRSFSRSIELPSPINQEAVKASMKDGILSIILPKLKEQKVQRRIEIL